MKLLLVSLSNTIFKCFSVVATVFIVIACGSGASDQVQVPPPVVNPPPPTDPAPEPPPEVVPESSELTSLSDGTQVPTEALISVGERIYFDTGLSEPVGQSCASCHSEQTGFDDPNQFNPTSLGADGVSFGDRNSPTASYAAFIPDRQTVNRPAPGGGPVRPVLIGGLFLDGRAVNLEEQAKGPFLNPVEMGNRDMAQVIQKVSGASYANEFAQLFGADIFTNAELAYDYVADSIAAFERTEVFSPFSAKFDQVQNGTAVFTPSENRGERLFNGRAQCDRCHSTNNGPQVFSDFEYHNIGVPSNSLLPALINDAGFVDLGLGAVTNNANDNGKFRTPNLRNIAITTPYMHNGVFNNLTEVIEFYNTRDTNFPLPPEVNQNINQGGNIGELSLSDQDIQDLVAFLQTLTDQ